MLPTPLAAASPIPPDFARSAIGVIAVFVTHDQLPASSSSIAACFEAWSRLDDVGLARTGRDLERRYGGQHPGTAGVSASPGELQTFFVRLAALDQVLRRELLRMCAGRLRRAEDAERRA